MKLFDYLDGRFRELSIDLQKNFSIQKDAELKAAYALIQAQRTFFKYLIIPVLFTKYILINLGLLHSPFKSKVIIEQSDAEQHVPEADNIN